MMRMSMMHEESLAKMEFELNSQQEALDERRRVLAVTQARCLAMLDSASGEKGSERS